MSEPGPTGAAGHVRIAAVVLNYRDAAHTIACLRSIAHQAVERIVVWDNSQDGGASAGELAGLLSAEPTGPCAIEQVTSPLNLGFAAGVNAAIHHIDATGGADCLLLVNNDAVLPEGAVHGLLSALVSQPDAVAVAPRVRTAGLVQGLIHHHRWLAIQTAKPLPGSFAYASGCCLLLASERVPRPVFDEAFFMYAEDVALGWSLRCANQHIALAGDVVVDHAGAASSELGSPFYEYQTALGHFLLTGRLARGRIRRAAMAVTRTLAVFTRAVVRMVRTGSSVPVVQTLRAFRDAAARSRRRDR